jgi:hypothetical protein
MFLDTYLKGTGMCTSAQILTLLRKASQRQLMVCVYSKSLPGLSLTVAAVNIHFVEASFKQPTNATSILKAHYSWP